MTPSAGQFRLPSLPRPDRGHCRASEVLPRRMDLVQYLFLLLDHRTTWITGPYDPYLDVMNWRDRLFVPT